jgi:protein-L-isoaspartate(D-aspartate) O-methyltransferase
LLHARCTEYAPQAAARDSDRERFFLSAPPFPRAHVRAWSMEIDQAAALAIVRRAYAKQVLAAAGIEDARVAAAFAAVRRERFPGGRPWPIFRWLRDYVATPTADPVYLYTDDLVGILPTSASTTASPSLHALLVARAGIRDGDHVVHVGAGVGYYTAIMAHLAGATGRATAIELEPELAARAQANLAAAANVRVVAGDGTAAAFRFAPTSST